MNMMLTRLLSGEPLILGNPSSGVSSGGVASSGVPAPGAETFLQAALPIIGWGLLGTFAVILLIAAATAILNKVTNRKK